MNIVKVLACMFVMSLSAGAIEASDCETINTNSVIVVSPQTQSKVGSGKSYKKSSKKGSKDAKTKKGGKKTKCVGCKKTFVKKDLTYVAQRNGYMCRPCYVKWHNNQSVF